MPDGQFVEVHPDSLETDSARKARPQFKSDGGRVVYGGGAVTPDLLVQADTLTTAEQDFRKAMAPKSQEYYVALYDLAYELKSQVKPDFTVKPEWRSRIPLAARKGRREGRSETVGCCDVTHRSRPRIARCTVRLRRLDRSPTHAR